MMFLLLVDGSSLLSTSFYGTVPQEFFRAKTEEDRDRAMKKLLKTKNGEYTNGVFTMMKILEKIIKKQQPTHLAVAWDVNRETFRRQEYPEYKAQREETRPELRKQFQLTQEVLTSMGIAQFWVNGYEADDVIGSLAHHFKESLPVFILSKDQDVLQLVDDRVRVWLVTSKCKEMREEVGLKDEVYNIPDGTFEFTPTYIEHFYQITPQQIIDKKAIEGDSSDNIPGVKGVGETSVIPLLKEFGTVEAIYEYLEENDESVAKDFFKSLGIKRSPINFLLKTSESDLVGKEAALLSKKLATIHLSVPGMQEVRLEDLVLQINSQGRKTIYERLEFQSLLNNQ